MTFLGLVRFTATGLGRRPVRTILTVVGLAVLVLTYVSVQSLVSTLEFNVQGSVSALGGAIDVWSKGIPYPLFSVIPESYSTTIRSIPGVNLAAPIALAQLTVDNDEAVVVGVVPSELPSLLSYTMLSGSMIKTNESGVLSIGKFLATTIGKTSGQTVVLDGKNYSVTGVYQTNAWMDYSLMIPHSVLQQLIGWSNQTSMIVVTTQDPRNVDTVIGQIRTLLPSTDAFRTSEAPSRISPLFASFEAIAADITVIVSLSAVLGIMNSNLNNLRERMRAFAIFKATGASSGQIIKLVFYESLMLGLLGSALGLGVSYVALRLVSIPVAPTVNVTIILLPVTFIYAAILAISVSLAAAIYPALRTARVRPKEVFRFG